MGHDPVDAVVGPVFTQVDALAGLFERSGDEPEFGVRNDRFDAVFVLAFEFLPFMFRHGAYLGEVGGRFDHFVSVFIVTKQFDRQIARRIAGNQVGIFPDLVLQQPDAVFDVFPVIDVDMPHDRFVVFEHVDHGFEQFPDSFAAGGDGRHDRDSDHPAQITVVQFQTRLFELVVHVQRDHDLQVHVDQLRGQEQVAFEVRGVQHVDNHVGHGVENVPAHVKFFGRVFGDRIGARQVEQVERVAVLPENGLFGVDRHAAVIADPFVGAGRDVEQRCLARIRIADQRDVDGSARYVLKTVDRFVPERSAGRKSRPRRSAARQRNFDQFRLAFAQGDAVTHDFVFDGIRQRGVFDDPHRFAANESHFCDPVAKRAVSEHFGDDPFFRRLQFRQAFIYDFFFHLSSDREIFSGQRYATGGFRKIPEAGEKGFPRTSNRL